MHFACQPTTLLTLKRRSNGPDPWRPPHTTQTLQFIVEIAKFQTRAPAKPIDSNSELRFHCATLRWSCALIVHAATKTGAVRR